MTIKSRQHQIDSSEVAEPTQVLVPAAREKYVQRWQQDGGQAVSQVIHSTTLVGAEREKYMQEWPQDGDQAVSQTIVSTTPEVSVVVPTRNEQDNIWPPMRRKNFYDKFPSVAAVAGVHLAGSLLSVSRPRGLLGLAGRPT